MDSLACVVNTLDVGDDSTIVNSMDYHTKFMDWDTMRAQHSSVQKRIYEAVNSKELADEDLGVKRILLELSELISQPEGFEKATDLVSSENPVLKYTVKTDSKSFVVVPDDEDDHQVTAENVSVSSDGFLTQLEKEAELNSHLKSQIRGVANLSQGTTLINAALEAGPFVQNDIIEDRDVEDQVAFYERQHNMAVTCEPYLRTGAINNRTENYPVIFSRKYKINTSVNISLIIVCDCVEGRTEVKPVIVIQSYDRILHVDENDGDALLTHYMHRDLDSLSYLNCRRSDLRMIKLEIKSGNYGGNWVLLSDYSCPEITKLKCNTILLNALSWKNIVHSYNKIRKSYTEICKIANLCNSMIENIKCYAKTKVVGHCKGCKTYEYVNGKHSCTKSLAKIVSYVQKATMRNMLTINSCKYSDLFSKLKLEILDDLHINVYSELDKRLCTLKNLNIK